MTHLFTKHELLNVTTGYTHTRIEDIVSFFERVISPGIYIHMLPRAYEAIQPLLQEKLTLPFSGYHPEMDNEIIAIEFTESDVERFWVNMARP